MKGSFGYKKTESSQTKPDRVHQLIYFHFEGKVICIKSLLANELASAFAARTLSHGTTIAVQWILLAPAAVWFALSGVADETSLHEARDGFEPMQLKSPLYRAASDGLW